MMKFVLLLLMEYKIIMLLFLQSTKCDTIYIMLIFIQMTIKFIVRKFATKFFSSYKTVWSLLYSQ